MLVWMAMAASAGAPAAIEWTAEEQARLTSGKVVVRPPAEASDQAVGAVDVRASADVVWAAVFDFPARVAEISALERAEVYAPASDPGGLGVVFELSVFGAEIVFHTRYQCDFVANYCTYGLDPARENDLVAVVGSYEVIALPDGGSRLVYRSRTDSGRTVPGFVRRWLAVDALSTQLEGIQRRAGS